MVHTVFHQRYPWLHLTFSNILNSFRKFQVFIHQAWRLSHACIIAFMRFYPEQSERTIQYGVNVPTGDVYLHLLTKTRQLGLVVPAKVQESLNVFGVGSDDALQSSMVGKDALAEPRLLYALQ